MENIYQKMYENYSQAIEKNIEQSGKLVLDFPYNEKEKKSLATFIRHNSDNSGDDGTASFVLNIIEKKKVKLSPASLNNASDYIKRLLSKTNDSKMKNLLRKLLNFIEEVKDLVADIEKQTGEKIKDSNTEAIDPSKINTVDLDSQIERYKSKLNDYRNFAKQRTKDPSYFATHEVEIDTTPLDDLSRDELVDCFKPENFYKLSPRQIQMLLQATSNEYLKSNNVEPCAVCFRNLRLDEHAITYGEYSPSNGDITINQKVLDQLEAARENNDKFYPYQLLSTLIHEARHRVQFSNLNNPNLSDRDNLVSQAIMHPSKNPNFSSYLGALEEIDARDAAMQYIKNQSERSNSDIMKAYYNSSLYREQRNQKCPIPKEQEHLFKNIYGASMLPTSYNHKGLSNQLIQTLTSQPQLARELCKN